MANKTTNTTPAIRQQIYGQLVQETLKSEFFGMDPLFEISEFVDGDTYNMPTVGQMGARTATVGTVEDEDVIFDALDTGRVTLTVDTYDHIAWYETKKLQEDAYLNLIAMQGLQEAMHGMRAAFETNLWKKHSTVQAAADPNIINGAAHRFVATGTSQVVATDLSDFAYIKQALDKALVPTEGRIMIVDPAVEFTLNKLVGAQGFTNNPRFEGMVTEGFRKNYQFIRNIYGLDIYVSNFLPKIASESINASAVGRTNASVTNGVCNFAFSVASESVKPLMGAWRRRPELESWEDKEKLDTRTNYKITSRYGMAAHRLQGLVTMITSQVG